MSELSTGTFLLAEPYMQDAHFKRAVVLLTDYNDTGTVGFILNKPIASSINDLIKDFPEIESPVYYGGPVAQETLHYIHDVGEILDDSIKVGSGVYWSGDFEKLKFLINAQLVKPHNIRFFLGYSGWSPGQLEDEMRFGSWVTADFDSNYVFATKHKEMWRRVMKNKGEHYSVIAEMPDSYVLN